jgi:hypothetical protein
MVEFFSFKYMHFITGSTNIFECKRVPGTNQTETALFLFTTMFDSSYPYYVGHRPLYDVYLEYNTFRALALLPTSGDQLSLYCSIYKQVFFYKHQLRGLGPNPGSSEN